MLSQLKSPKNRPNGSIINRILYKSEELYSENAQNTTEATTTTELLPQMPSKISSTLPQNEVKILDGNRDIKIDSQTEQFNKSCDQCSVIDLKFNNMLLISTKQRQFFAEDIIFSTTNDYWTITELIRLHDSRRSSNDDIIPKTHFFLNQVPSGQSELYKTGTTGNNTAKTTNEFQIEKINTAECVKNNTDKETFMRKFTKWLTTLDVKSCETGSDSKENSSFFNQLRTMKTAKTLNINGRDINMIAPSSF